MKAEEQMGMPKSGRRFLNTRDMVLIAMSAALITIGSWINITLGPVPFTLQLLMIYAILMSLGGKRGTMAILVYLLMGLVGLPVFAQFKGGPASLAGPTGGLIVGFVAVGGLYWVIADVLLRRVTGRCGLKASAVRFAVCLVTQLVLYAVGTVWFVNIYTGEAGGMSYGATLSVCVIPFIVPDILKIALAVLLAGRVRRLVK